MRKLHPAGVEDVEIDAGRFLRPDGTVETWTTHRAEGGRRVVRVETGAGDLWHVVVAEDGRPERLEARLVEGGVAGAIDIACTCFDDEALIWRRGAEPASEAVAVPPGYRLLWPPIAGRAECLGDWLDRTPGAGPAAVMLLWVTRRGAARGGLRFRPVKFTLWAEALAAGDEGGAGTGRQRESHAPAADAAMAGAVRRIHLTTPGLPDVAADLDAAGRLLRWSDGGAVAERAAEGG